MSKCTGLPEIDLFKEIDMSLIDRGFFDYVHLPADLQVVSKQAYALAEYMHKNLQDCEEKRVGMRKLLEAKDCFVRAAITARKDSNESV
jgi:hypothetical protein